MKKRIKKSEFDLNTLPFLPEIIKEVRSFLPKSWVLYKKGKYNLKKGDAVRIEKIDYGNLKSKNNCIQVGRPFLDNKVPPTIDCVGKILSFHGDRCFIRFLKKSHTMFADGYYIIDKKHIRRANFPDKKKVTLNKKNIITFFHD